jgi:hypothetical protein
LAICRAGFYQQSPEPKKRLKTYVLETAVVATAQAAQGLAHVIQGQRQKQQSLMDHCHWSESG